ncbi:hypothetical protein BHM03_00050043, partial [Ensete ventricosum]
VKAEEELRHVPTLYGFLEPPPLDVLTTWSENRNESVGYLMQEWIYYLNEGAQVEITYSVKSLGTYPLILVIAQVSVYILNYFSSNIGFLKQVLLTFRIQAVLYNTTGAYYKCSLHHRFCALKLSLQRANVAILTTPAPDPISEWYVKLSYGPRWITYFAGSGPELLKDGEINNSQELCAICCDAPRDCFFLPCGHCAISASAAAPIVSVVEILRKLGNAGSCDASEMGHGESLGGLFG